MCGRVNITDNEGVRLLMELVGMPSWPTIQARYNVAPSAQLDGIVWNEELSHQEFHWGLVPLWAKPGQFSSPLINARSESVWEKPSFRNLVKQQRACVPVTGFYEWQRKSKEKIPYFIFPATNHAMFLAGIFQRTQIGEGIYRTDLSLLTTGANETMGKVHHRMPVIIQPDDVPNWLNANPDEDRKLLDQMMLPSANDFLNYRPVSSYVNNARNDGPQCIEAA